MQFLTIKDFADTQTPIKTTTTMNIYIYQTVDDDDDDDGKLFLKVKVIKMLA